MHIPDGFIPLWQCAIYFVILAVALIISLRWARRDLDEKRVPLLAVLAAGIFAIMSMNVPIPWGTSGHMVGGALVALIFMAPEAAVIVFTLVLIVQGLFFGDGGLTALKHGDHRRMRGPLLIQSPEKTSGQSAFRKQSQNSINSRGIMAVHIHSS